MNAGTDTANIAVSMSPAPSPVSVNLVSSWQETTDRALVSDAQRNQVVRLKKQPPMSLKSARRSAKGPQRLRSLYLGDLTR